MKTVRNVYQKITSFSVLYQSYLKARLGKRDRDYVIHFSKHLEENMLELRNDLRNYTYQTGPYSQFAIYEPKERIITAASFRDRIVHHAVVDTLEPFIDPTFIEDSYACRKGKGTHKAIDRCQQLLKRYDWVLKCDIRKYFPSIDHKILKANLKRRIQDKSVLWLLDLMIDESPPQEPALYYYKGDDLFTPLERKKGIPIGNLTSQFFANLMLDPLDRFIKHELQIKGYVRYMDDFILFSNSKSQLFDARRGILDKLSSLRLQIHPKKQDIFPSKQSVPFLGFRIFKDYRKLLRNNVDSFSIRAKHQWYQVGRHELSYDELRTSLIAWIGHAEHANTWNLRKKTFQKIFV